MNDVDFSTRMGVVVIGRNEGERLRLCLGSIIKKCKAVVYVDSGSIDDSVSLARKLGVTVVNLDLTTPFTAARARNSGFKLLLEQHPYLNFVQFVDGDCEITNTWLERAVEFLDQNPNVGVVCGRRRERYPDKSIYNYMCDIEWDTPIGAAKACGGDALMRIAMLETAGGFRDDLIAGEEPELCVRLRAAGWQIWRLPEEMTLHDAAIFHFSQWWQRTKRAGYAYAEGCYLHGFSKEKHFLRESLRAWVWGGLLPAGIILFSILINPFYLAISLIYLLQILRIALKSKHADQRWLLACFLVLGKFPEFVGQLKFVRNRFGCGKSKLIEYK